MIGNALNKKNLVNGKPQNVQQTVVDLAKRKRGELRDDVIERESASDNSGGEPRGEPTQMHGETPLLERVRERVAQKPLATRAGPDGVENQVPQITQPLRRRYSRRSHWTALSTSEISTSVSLHGSPGQVLTTPMTAFGKDARIP